MPLQRVPVEERFWTKVDVRGPDACWIWKASTARRGYGKIGVNGRTRQAHRIAWELTHGSIPDGASHHGTCVLDKCDVPNCVNPAHLFLGTMLDNTRDMDAKGRRVNPCSLKTHCHRGHEFDTSNTLRANGQRICRACNPIKSAAWRARESVKRESVKRDADQSTVTMSG